MNNFSAVVARTDSNTVSVWLLSGDSETNFNITPEQAQMLGRSLTGAAGGWAKEVQVHEQKTLPHSPRACPTCHEVIKRRPDDSDRKFRVRMYCNKECFYARSSRK